MKGASAVVAAAIGAYNSPGASTLPKCGKCGEYVVLTPDAIGRLRERCPRCDGVARRVRVHPDEVLVPQTLVRVQALPPVRPGQLRCQVCAKGVDDRGRLCPACTSEAKKRAARTRISRGPAIYPPKACRKCGREFQPTGPASRYCEAHR